MSPILRLGFPVVTLCRASDHNKLNPIVIEEINLRNPLSNYLPGQIASPVYHAEDNSSKLFHLLKDFPTQAQGLLVAGENVVKSFTCDEIDLFAPKPALGCPLPELPMLS
ncbi:hypothetical protein DSO57_1014090 [Entomophthora muscae]|uniref:Uncharacterized protein n=1 Tax=Entomophthora muscae TaxID=34485 RepID=A0ACC2UF63_9FUNG|nr:hypothetical protein DSO57_1014090 [Entomophthora muscae]